jgi:hypothetical protein
MQLTAITAILAAAVSASATPLDARAAPSVIGHFYGPNPQGCNANDLHYTFEFEQDNTAQPPCHNLSVPANINIFATNFTDNTLTRKSECLRRGKLDLTYTNKKKQCVSTSFRVAQRPAAPGISISCPTLTRKAPKMVVCLRRLLLTKLSSFKRHVRMSYNEERRGDEFGG